MTSVTISLASLLRAASALQYAARYDEALELLDLPDSLDGGPRLSVLMARLAVEGHRDHASGVRSRVGGSLEAAKALAAEVGPEPHVAWDLAMLELRRDYGDQLVDSDGGVWLGPEGRDAALMDHMTAQARLLRDTAPDDARRGWASMCLGWFSDNLAGDRAAAPAHYAEALGLGRATDDSLLIFEAQRHLGDHAHDAGHHQAALEAWRESAAAAARAGHLTGVLSQQILLALLAREAGDEPGATMLARELRRWAAEIGARDVVRQADGFLAGVDPTQAPEPTMD